MHEVGGVFIGWEAHQISTAFSIACILPRELYSKKRVVIDIDAPKASFVISCAVHCSCRMTFSKSPVTPMAVTSPPAPAPWTISGLEPYRWV